MLLRRSRWSWPVAIVVVIGVAFTPPLRVAGRRFFSSLRIAKPQAAAAALAAPATGGARQLQDAVAGMVAPAPKITVDEPARDLPNAGAASTLAGFVVQLVAARRDTPTIVVIGARDVEAAIERAQLRTILDEAGDRGVAAPVSLQGATFRIDAPRAVRAQYGHCPPSVSNTIQGQLQGPPPPSTDYGDCLVLLESPPARVTGPPGLDVRTLVAIALELSGMSPSQTRAFQQRIEPAAALALSLPRFMRSYDTISVSGTPAMLLNTAGRRGPTYAVVWFRNNLVYELSGYGSAGDAAALASAVR
jgi:hypothetical protein